RRDFLRNVRKSAPAEQSPLPDSHLAAETLDIVAGSSKAHLVAESFAPGVCARVTGSLAAERVNSSVLTRVAPGTKIDLDLSPICAPRPSASVIGVDSPRCRTVD